MADERQGLSARTITAGAWAVLLLALWLWGRGADTGMDGGASGAALDGASAAQVLEKGPPALKPVQGAGPQSVLLDTVGVNAPVIERGLDKDGAVEPPPFASPDEVGWFRGGAEPGAAGPAIFVGHMDTASKPAVFYRLNDVRPGEKAIVVRDDGVRLEYTVERVEMMTKDGFNAERVYGPHKQGRAELRLITCGGAYDPLKHSYTANLVVSGYLTGKSS